MHVRSIILTLIAVLLARQAFPSAELFLPIPRSGRRSVRYFADHDLKQRDPKAEYAVVMVHGVDGGCSDCTPRLREIIKGHPQHDKVFFIAPCFPIPSMLNETEKRKIVYWEENRWQAGNDSLVADKLSPYDVLDLIFKSLNDVRLYPNLRHVLFCGYSAGGQIVSRYMAVSGIKARKGLAVDFAAGAPSTWLFLNENAMWHCGLANRNRYASRVSNKDIFKNIEKRFMLCFCGTADVDTKDLSVGPQAMAQGATRIERFTNFRKHIATFKKLKGAFTFVEVEGVGHSFQCWDSIGIDKLILGERGAIGTNSPSRGGSSDKTPRHRSGKDGEKAKE